ncbi:hypothetical protein N0V86_007557 [Didymella sp. IMI 355093]|nr:hypothetical protein N0V86_007557 [Didymella sp. IMI 355093]
MAILDEAISTFKTDPAAEQALLSFMNAHHAQYLRLARRAPSAAGSVDAKDTTARDKAINKLKVKIERYDTASGSLRAAENAALEAKQDAERAEKAVAEKRRGRVPSKTWLALWMMARFGASWTKSFDVEDAPFELAKQF